MRKVNDIVAEIRVKAEIGRTTGNRVGTVERLRQIVTFVALPVRLGIFFFNRLPIPSEMPLDDTSDVIPVICGNVRRPGSKL
jgi:hypothetical protein